MSALTAASWQLERRDSPLDPDRLRFDPRGEYEARFTATACSYTGSWSLFVSAADSGQISLSVPAHDCDPRGRAEAVVRELPVALDGTRLRLYETTYSADG